MIAKDSKGSQKDSKRPKNKGQITLKGWKVIQNNDKETKTLTRDAKFPQ